MGRLRTPWTSQPPLGTPIDPAWAARGLQLVFDGQRVVFNRESSALQPRALGGTPRFRNSLKGIVTGIGATSGTGTTDRIDSGVLDAPKSGMRSVVAHLYANGTGGGGLGRVFQNASGSGIANVGDEAVYFNGSAMLFARQTSTFSGASYTTTPAFPTGRWASYGFSFMGDYPTNTAPVLFIDGVPVGVTTIAAAGSAFTANTSMNMSWGNRVSDSARSFDGMIGPVLIFDGYLTPQEHARLSANPWQVFQPLARNVFSDVAAGGPTYTLTSAGGSFALTGQDTGLAFNRVLVADAQSYALTGQAAGLAFNRTLSAASGSYSLTGQDAGLAFNRVLSAASGSYALTGQDATLTYTPIGGATYTLVAASGSFALTGQDTGLAFNRVLAADTQSYSLAVQAAGLAFNRVLVADTTSFALTGQDATLTYTTNGYTYTLSAESGSFALSGRDASLIYSGSSSGGGTDDGKAKQRDKVRRKVAKLNAEILEKEQTVAPEKTTSTKLVKAISKKAIQQVFDEDEEDLLMLLLS